METFQIQGGFRIELFAAEPLIADPVAMEIDERGRIYVVEMPGYPLDASGTGRVRLLEDTDGDGYPDRSTIFADRLVLPSGVMRWKKGILVTDPPEILYLEDTDADGRADIRRTVLTGFAFSNPQHRMNGPVYGLDNWIYIAHEPPATAVIFQDKFEDRGSSFRFPERPDLPPIPNKGRSVRLRLDRFELEQLASRSQFGHTFDRWGHYFTVNNSNHVMHQVLEARYLERNPDLQVAGVTQDMSDHGNAAEIFPITDDPRFEILTEIGTITSACGLTLYLGGLFPEPFERVSFVAEPAHNLVHADVWSDSGSTFMASRLEEGREFLASTDSWFRPVNFYIGPDGALYVLDFYREIIEHPEWMSQEATESGRLYNGSDRGRIYRIVPAGWKVTPPARALRLDQASDRKLVAHLESPNIWWRRTAQRLLVDRRSKAAVAHLARLFRESRSAAGRLHALWTLEGIDELETSLIDLALSDPEPGVRENAIRLAEARLQDTPAPGGAGASARLLQLTDDPDPKVRFQLLCTLGNMDSDKARQAREDLLFQNIEDSWMHVAALSALDSSALRLFRRALARLTDQETEARAAFLKQVCAVIGAAGKMEEIGQVVEEASKGRSPGTLWVVTARKGVGPGLSKANNAGWWRAAGLDGLATGFQSRGASNRNSSSPDRQQAATIRQRLVELFQSPDESIRAASLRMLEATGLPEGPIAQEALQRAASAASDRTKDAGLRSDSIRLLTLAGPQEYQSLLRPLVTPGEPLEVQTEAVRAIGRIDGDETARFIISNWKRMTPQVRLEAGEALSRTPQRRRMLIEALESREIQPWTLAFRERRRLIMNRDAEDRRRGRAILEQAEKGREKVIERYRKALQLQGDAGRGQLVFEQTCARCHQIGASQFGPDLATIKNRSREALLRDILAPSQAIAQNYEVFVVGLKSGALLEGIIAAQTPTTITLRHEDGEEDIVRREDIDRMYASTLSAMPEGLDQEITLQEMADLLAYLLWS